LDREGANGEKLENTTPHNEELRNLHSSLDIIRVTRSWWDWHVM